MNISDKIDTLGDSALLGSTSREGVLVDLNNPVTDYTYVFVVGLIHTIHRLTQLVPTSVLVYESSGYSYSCMTGDGSGRYSAAFYYSFPSASSFKTYGHVTAGWGGINSVSVYGIK